MSSPIDKSKEHKWTCCLFCHCSKKEEKNEETEKKTQELIKDITSLSPPSPNLSSRTMRWIKETPPQAASSSITKKYRLPDEPYGK